MKHSAEQGTVIPAASSGHTTGRNERSIGTILIQSKRLTLEDAERVLQLQRAQGLRFGDAAVQLGLLSQADIDFALARQFDFPYLIRGDSPVHKSVIAAYAPFSPQGQIIGSLRGQLMLRWFDNEESRKSLAIVSAEREEGRSYVSANLAVSFSQLGHRTLLIDADMRNPSQHLLFGVDNRSGLSAVLAGRTDLDSITQPVPDLKDLSILPVGAIPPNPLELLTRPHFARLLADLARQYDIILIDTPATSMFSDAQTIAVRAGAALIVARKNKTRMWRVRGVSDTVSHASATVIGTVLNDF